MSARQSDERRRLARAGAEGAASAFEMLVDRPTRVASVAALDSGERGAAFSGEWSSGVFFELEGCFDALVAVMFRSDSRDALVERGYFRGELQGSRLYTQLLHEAASAFATQAAQSPPTSRPAA